MNWPVANPGYEPTPETLFHINYARIPLATQQQGGQHIFQSTPLTHPELQTCQPMHSSQDRQITFPISSGIQRFGMLHWMQVVTEKIELKHWERSPHDSKSTTPASFPKELNKPLHSSVLEDSRSQSISSWDPLQASSHFVAETWTETCTDFSTPFLHKALADNDGTRQCPSRRGRGSHGTYHMWVNKQES